MEEPSEPLAPTEGKYCFPQFKGEEGESTQGAVIYPKDSKAHVLMYQLGVLSVAQLHLFHKLPHL